MTDLINNLEPGKEITPEQKAKLAKENLAISTDAHKLATEHRARDVQEGRGEPAVQTVASLIKKKLVNEDFSKKEK